MQASTSALLRDDTENISASIGVELKRMNSEKKQSKALLFDFCFFKIAMFAQDGVIFFQYELFRNIARVLLGDVKITCTFCADQSDFLYS